MSIFSLQNHLIFQCDNSAFTVMILRCKCSLTNQLKKQSFLDIFNKHYYFLEHLVLIEYLFIYNFHFFRVLFYWNLVYWFLLHHIVQKQYMMALGKTNILLFFFEKKIDLTVNDIMARSFLNSNWKIFPYYVYAYGVVKKLR